MVIKVKIKQVQIIVNCIIYCKWAVTTTVDSLPDSYCPSLGTKARIHQTVLLLCRIMFMFTRENKLLLLLCPIYGHGFFDVSVGCANVVCNNG